MPSLYASLKDEDSRYYINPDGTETKIVHPNENSIYYRRNSFLEDSDKSSDRTILYNQNQEVMLKDFQKKENRNKNRSWVDALKKQIKSTCFLRPMFF